ncbi:Adenylate kinase AAA domain [Trypanosoma vivax]|uniref:Putative adenylate kinase n=1 Tax=Trypanosoma vivax (strain Y486) TaxID=1055687 RepID=G0U681_TRYVY|nr:putative adenylate kinase [Trypanosoma vivax]KAH8611599.1 Adenylate kinase AAA domain [Trypanosoma vivax]CCC51384.1 putative adenylate kinase [Trypanosoma vivax Y486]
MGLHLLVFGAPGCGKGTASEHLVRDYGLVHISTGGLLRDEVLRGSELGRQVEMIMSEGNLIPDELITRIVTERLRRPDIREKGVLLDGFPRTPKQAEKLSASGFEVDALIYLHVDHDKLAERCLLRRLDPVTGRIYNLKNNPPPPEVLDRLLIRSDDTREKHRRRMEIYNRQKDLIMQFYRGKVLEVDANPPFPVVYKEICARVNHLRDLKRESKL